jgi:DNA (cytosine-5)-methyltransferase 1
VTSKLQALIIAQSHPDSTLAKALTLASDVAISDDDLIYFTHLLQSDRPSVRGRYRRRILSKELKGLIPKQEALPHRPRGTQTFLRDNCFRFIDLFAGAGGMRLGMQYAGGKCVFSSEIDDFARATYFRNFGEVPFGDIHEVDRDDIPEHDVLVGGFPCQPFSIAGLQQGFKDKRGGLFFEIESILKSHTPKAFLLENVSGLKSRRSIDALGEMLQRLSRIGYHWVPPQLLNARHFGVPQNRPRVFIVGFRSKAAMSRFRFPLGSEEEVAVKSILSEEPVDPRYYLSKRLLATLQAHKKRHQKNGNGFGLQILDPNRVANTIVVGGMGHERNLIRDPMQTGIRKLVKNLNDVNTEIRRMTPDEWAALQGYPETFTFPVSDTQAYKQLGNSVAVPLIESLGKQVVRALHRS